MWEESCAPIPDRRWVRSFHQKCMYNDWQKKLKQPCMDRMATAAHAKALFSVAQKPWVAGSVWQAIHSSTKILASVLQGYSDYLANANEKQQERQAQLCPVHQLSEHNLVTCRDAKPFSSSVLMRRKWTTSWFMKKLIVLCSLMTKGCWAKSWKLINATSSSSICWSLAGYMCFDMTQARHCCCERVMVGSR